MFFTNWPGVPHDITKNTRRPCRCSLVHLDFHCRYGGPDVPDAGAGTRLPARIGSAFLARRHETRVCCVELSRRLGAAYLAHGRPDRCRTRHNPIEEIGTFSAVVARWEEPRVSLQSKRQDTDLCDGGQWDGRDRIDLSEERSREVSLVARRAKSRISRKG